MSGLASCLHRPAAGVIDLITNSAAESQKFFKLQKACIEHIKETRDLEKHIPWEAAQKQLLHLSDSSTIWEQPADLYIPYKDYVLEQGDPAVNGKGHVTGNNMDGELCVIVPESRIMKKRREVRDTNRLQTLIADSSDSGPCAQDR